MAGLVRNHWQVWAGIRTYPKDALKWNINNPSIGQCAVTSLVVQKYLKGKIVRNSKYNHYWNILPSGHKVDFTYQQFNITKEIPLESECQRNDLLEGDKSLEADTTKRYKFLDTAIKYNFKLLKPSIFLISSNAQSEYILDIIETMALPHGSIHHFRYSNKYIDPALRELIPLQGNKMPKFLSEARVIVFYLNQQRNKSNNYVWNDMLPVRSGILKNCYKTGEDEYSIIHFFFEIQDAIIPGRNYLAELKNIYDDQYQKAYAFLTYVDWCKYFKTVCSKNTFEEQCKVFYSVGLSFKDKKKITNYSSPIMGLIEGIYKKNYILPNSELKPKFDKFSNKSVYKLKEAKSYYIKYRTFTNNTKKKFQVKMKLFQSSFTTPNEYIQNINSSYHSECWEIRPAYLEQGTCGFFDIEFLTLKNSATKSNELDWKITIAYEINRRFFLRLLDVVNDLFLALGPIYLAATKIIEDSEAKPWYVTKWPILTDWPIIISIIYGFWFITKIIRNAIRGK